MEGGVRGQGPGSGEGRWAGGAAAGVGAERVSRCPGAWPAGGEGVAPGSGRGVCRGAWVPTPAGRAGSRVGAAGADWLAGARAGRAAARRGRSPRSPASASARRRPARAHVPPAATMSTGLRYKSKLATPGEPGARPRARAHSFVPAARTPLTVCLGLSPARRPGPGPRPDPRPDPAEDKQVRVRRRSPGPLSPIVPPTPRRPNVTPPPPAVILLCRDNR